MKVIDNFLPNAVFENIHKNVMGNDLTWFYRPTVAREDDKDESWNYFYSHLAYDEDRPWSTLYDVVFPFVNQVHQVEPLKACMRIKLRFMKFYQELPLH